MDATGVGGEEGALQKVGGDLNAPDSQAKYLNKDLLDRFCRMCSCDVPEGIHDNAFTVKGVESYNHEDRGGAARGGREGPIALCHEHHDWTTGFNARLKRCHDASGPTLKALFNPASASGRAKDLQAWSRQDLMTSTLRSTTRGGPDWKSVHGRVTFELETGRVIEARLRGDMKPSDYHAKLLGGTTNTITYLLFVTDRLDIGGGMHASNQSIRRNYYVHNL